MRGETRVAPRVAAAVKKVGRQGGAEIETAHGSDDQTSREEERKLLKAANRKIQRLHTQKEKLGEMVSKREKLIEDLDNEGLTSYVLEAHGHSKMKEDGLHADNMNAKYGGKQSKLRPSVLTEGCVGTAPAVAKWVEHGAQMVRDMRLKVGDTQVFVFQPSDPPPFNCPTAPRHDTHNTAKPNKLVTPRKKKGQAQPEPAQTVPNIIEGYVGKAKGTAQILWERGLYDARMKLDAPTIIKDAVGHVVTIPSMRQVLSACPDFLNEKTSMQELVESRGHILCMTPKYHPELAGVGIEFSWGRAKYMFRKEINDFKATNLKANVMRALSTQGDGAVLPLALVRRYARRARDYLRAYAANPGPKEFKMIEKMKQHQKTHRSIFDLEFAFLGSA